MFIFHYIFGEGAMRNIFLKGIPKGFWEDDIARLVAALKCTVTSSMVWKDKRGKSRGVALVEVETEEQAILLTQALKQRTIRRPEKEDIVEVKAGCETIVIGEGDNKWALCTVQDGDKGALIVESAFREASYVRGPDEEPRQRRVKEDPQEKQKRCEILRKERLAARRAELQAGVPAEERDCLLTLDKVRRMRAKFGDEIGQRCRSCWLLHPQCICTPATPPNILESFKHRTIVWLHPKEFGRLSNTGGLITVAFPPPQSHVLVAGLPEDEDKFMQELERDPEATFVLFPSDDALTAQEFMDSVDSDVLRHCPGGAGNASDWKGESAVDAKDSRDGRASCAAGGTSTANVTDEAVQTAGSAPGTEASRCSRVYTIILVDGTWQQARRLALKIPPHIKRVKLMPREAIDPVYKSPMRSQATPDRVCSLSAYVLLLKELNTPPPVCDYLFHLLHQKSEIVLGNCGKEWKQTDGLHSTPKCKAPRNRRKKKLAGQEGQDCAHGEDPEKEGEGEEEEEEGVNVTDRSKGRTGTQADAPDISPMMENMAI